jgi:hypothetical protein
MVTAMFGLSGSEFIILSIAMAIFTVAQLVAVWEVVTKEDDVTIKAIWLLVIFFTFPVGAAAYLIVGRAYRKRRLGR